MNSTVRPENAAHFSSASSLWLAVMLLACCVGISGCGGGGGGGGAAPTPPPPPLPPPPTITLSGTATFSRVPTSRLGLNYAATTAEPIRGAIIQVRSSDGATVLYQSATDALGNWSVLAPQATTVLVTVLAELGTATNVTTKVIDNASADAVYSIYVAKTTGVANEVGMVLNAASGWTGTSYGATRAAGPFAILDTIYKAQRLILGADPTALFPLLLVEWSPANSSATIGTSFFSPSTGRLSILGKEDEDTDEYDDHVIAHEWGHWFESRFSRSDSLGGAHGAGDILDETVAFGEGWGNAFSGIVTRDPLYIDTSGAHQAATNVVLDLEADEIPATATVGGGDARRLDGGWSELSVQELLWDAFDGGDGIADSDADGVSLGFTPLYRVLTGPQRTFAGFSSIYSFMFYVKAQQTASAANLTAREALENIGAHNAFEQTTPGYARYTSVPADGVAVTHDVDGDPLSTYKQYGPITANSDGNRLYNRLFFSAVAPSTGTFRIRATPLTATHDLIIRRGGGLSPQAIDRAFGGAEVFDLQASAGEVVVFSVGSFATATNPLGNTPFQLQFGTPAVVGKPQAPLPPAPPLSRADG